MDSWFADAVRAIEVSSAAEVVVEVRSRSGAYGDAEARFGAFAALVALLFILFAPWTFAPVWVPLGVVAAYMSGHLISRFTHLAQRFLTTRRERERERNE